MGELRERMDRDMIVRGLADRTRESYLAAVAGLAKFHRRPPDRLTQREVEAYLVHLTTERKLAWNTRSLIINGLRFFYHTTLGRRQMDFAVPRPKAPAQLPEILSREEVARLLSRPTNRKHRVLLMTAYATGLRVSELVALRVSAIDSDRMTIRVEQGKGRQDRYVMLSHKLLAVLREYWKVYRTRDWLFEGQPPSRPLTRSSVHKVFHKAKLRAGITKPVSVHGLRHSFATHLLERGVNIRKIQLLLGHRSLGSTQIYTHVAGDYLEDTPSPLDTLPDLGHGTSAKS